MTMLNETTIKTEPVALIWDSASKQSVDAQSGKVTWGVTVMVHRASQTYRELRAAADAAIQKTYPTGAPFNFKDWEAKFDPKKYPEFNPAEYVLVRFTSKDAKATFNGTQEIAREEFGRMVYPGAKVAVVGRVWCYLPDIKTANQTGVKWFYEGVQIVDATTAPRLSISAGMSSADVANAFGAQPSAASAFTSPPPVAAAVPVAAAAAVPAPAPAPVPAPNPNIVPPVATPKLTQIGHTIDTLLGAGWTIDQMRAEGYVA